MAIFKLQRLYGVHTQRANEAINQYISEKLSSPTLLEDVNNGGDKLDKILERSSKIQDKYFRSKKANTPERVLDILHNDPRADNKLKYSEYFGYKLKKDAEDRTRESKAKMNALLERFARTHKI